MRLHWTLLLAIAPVGATSLPDHYTKRITSWDDYFLFVYSGGLLCVTLRLPVELVDECLEKAKSGMVNAGKAKRREATSQLETMQEVVQLISPRVTTKQLTTQDTLLAYVFAHFYPLLSFSRLPMIRFGQFLCDATYPGQTNRQIVYMKKGLVSVMMEGQFKPPADLHKRIWRQEVKLAEASMEQLDRIIKNQFGLACVPNMDQICGEVNSFRSSSRSTQNDAKVEYCKEQVKKLEDKKQPLFQYMFLMLSMGANMTGVPPPPN